MRLRRQDLHVSVTDPVATSMNFLNEIAGRYPDAISLAAGRPYEGFFDIADIPRHLEAYLDHRRRGASEAELRTLLMQYGRTNGQIHDLVARMLATDENIEVRPEAIMVTAGCQEAMVVAIRGLCAGPDDVLLAASPCYVGLTGAARLLGVDVVPVPESIDGLDPADVVAAIRAVRSAGRNPRALYLVPNFANPSGACLGEAARRALVDVAAREDILLLEDDPYGLFGLDDEPRPTLKSLDTDQRVIYLGSFAKTCFPGARVGFLVADQIVVHDEGRHTLLAEELSAVKSMLTVNTAPLAQAVIGGILVRSGFSLRTANKDLIAVYRANLDALIAALAEHFPPGANPVRWNAPRGGFFATASMPFAADEALVDRAARDYGVLFTPMRFFYPSGGGERAIRLSCSALPAQAITEGVARIARLVADLSDH